MQNRLSLDLSKYFSLLLVLLLVMAPTTGLKAFRLLSLASPLEQESKTEPCNNSVQEIKEDSIIERRKLHHHQRNLDIQQLFDFSPTSAFREKTDWYQLILDPLFSFAIPILRAPPTFAF